ncbi:MAG: pyridoxamine 5'-phosphate oxidase family protein [Anaerotignum propionicum]|uniref:pyridoxamine 5'-phosphate oxidase family protein n=1 Tax=Anaerotignum propionicum TaxID=28446 RepID=UPI002B205A4E|nr:pyridoxamine 5'-phosphate oxidase family protein [Anaerotignum propionicum]MEA5057595.1 pyridoxamine 5'-phosphate oxidase family protein [Anaerotignum propionicum]
MQYRMKTHPLSEEQITKLLERSQTGSLATINPDGTPYVTPIHFVYYNNKIYAHGLPKGKKLDNIVHDQRIGFSVYEMNELLLDPNEKPCDTNTKYQSIIFSGNAKRVEDIQVKEDILKKVVEKYTPHLAGKELPTPMVKGTAVIEIDIMEMTGKYYS